MHNKLIQKLSAPNIMITIAILSLLFCSCSAQDECPDITEWTHGYIDAFLTTSGEVTVHFYYETYNQTTQFIERRSLTNTLLYVYAPDKEGNITVYYIVTDNNGTATFSVPYVYGNCTTITITYCYMTQPDDLDTVSICTGINTTTSEYPSGIEEYPGMIGGTLTLPGSVNSTVYAATREVRYCMPTAIGLDEVFCLPMFLILGLLAAAFYLSGSNPFMFFNLRGAPRFPRGRPYRMRKRRGTGVSVGSVAFAAVRIKEIAKKGVKQYAKEEWQTMKNFFKGAFVKPIKTPLGKYKKTTLGKYKKTAKAAAKKAAEKGGKAAEREGIGQLATIAATSSERQAGTMAPGYYSTYFRAAYEKWGVLGAIVFTHFVAPFLDELCPGLSSTVASKLFGPSRKARQLADALLNGEINGKKIDIKNLTKEDIKVSASGSATRPRINISIKTKDGWVELKGISLSDAHYIDATCGCGGKLYVAASNIISAYVLNKSIGDHPEKIKHILNYAKELKGLKGEDRKRAIKEIANMYKDLNPYINDTIAYLIAVETLNKPEFKSLLALSNTLLYENYGVGGLVFFVYMTSLPYLSYINNNPISCTEPTEISELRRSIREKEKRIKEIESMSFEELKKHRKELDRLRGELALLLKKYDELLKREKINSKILKLTQELNVLGGTVAAIMNKKSVGKGITNEEERLLKRYERLNNELTQLQGERLSLTKEKLRREGAVVSATVYIRDPITGELRAVTVDIVDQTFAASAAAAKARINAFNSAFSVYNLGGMDAGNLHAFVNNINWMGVPELNESWNIYDPFAMSSYALTLYTTATKFGAISNAFEQCTAPEQEFSKLMYDPNFAQDFYGLFADTNNWALGFDDKYLTSMPTEIENPCLDETMKLKTAVEEYQNTMKLYANNLEKGEVDAAERYWKEAQEQLATIKSLQEDINTTLANDKNYTDYSSTVWTWANAAHSSALTSAAFFGCAAYTTVSYYATKGTYEVTSSNTNSFDSMNNNYNEFKNDYTSYRNDFVFGTKEDVTGQFMQEYYSSAADVVLSSVSYELDSYDQFRRNNGVPESEPIRDYEEEIRNKYYETINNTKLAERIGYGKYEFAVMIRNQWSTVEHLLMEEGKMTDMAGTVKGMKEKLPASVESKIKKTIIHIDKYNKLLEKYNSIQKKKENVNKWINASKDMKEYEKRLVKSMHLTAVSDDYLSSGISSPDPTLHTAVLEEVDAVFSAIEEDDDKKANKHMKTITSIDKERSVLLDSTAFAAKIDPSFLEAPIPRTPTEMRLAYGKIEDPDIKKLLNDYDSSFSKIEGRIPAPAIPSPVGWSLVGTVWQRYPFTKRSASYSSNDAKRGLVNLNAIAKRIRSVAEKTKKTR